MLLHDARTGAEESVWRAACGGVGEAAEVRTVDFARAAGGRGVLACSRAGGVRLFDTRVARAAAAGGGGGVELALSRAGAPARCFQTDARLSAQRASHCSSQSNDSITPLDARPPAYRRQRQTGRKQTQTDILIK